MVDDDLGVFYDADDFGLRCTRSRPGEDDIKFVGILATVDESLFEGHLEAGVHVLRFPTAAAQMEPGDLVSILQAGSTVAEVWRVLRTPRRVLDGAESEVFLKPDPEA